VKTLASRWSFLILPIVFVIVWVTCVIAHGPSWLGLNSDPDYAYLLNALNLASGLPSGFGGHPGTPIEILGAAVLRAWHPMLDSRLLAEAVIAQPEPYLLAMKSLLAALYAGTLAFVGLRVRGLTGSTVAVLLAQASPLLSAAALQSTLQVKPEPLQLALAALLFVVALEVAQGERRRGDVKFGVLAGALLATKITSLPLVIVPLVMLRGCRQHLVFALSAFVSAAILTAPAWESLANLVVMMTGIATHTGEYGRGPAGLFDLVKWLSGLWFVVANSPIFVLAVLVGAGSLVNSRRCADPLAKLRASMIIAMVACAFMVARHPIDLRYLAAGLALVGPSLALVWLQFGDNGRAFHMHAAAVAALAASGLLVVGSTYRTLLQRRAEQLEVAEFVGARFAGVTTILSYAASSEAYALHFGNAYAGQRYSQALARAFPGALYFEPWTGTMSWYGGERLPPRRPAVVFGHPMNDPALRAFSGNETPSFANSSQVVYEMR
jgi:hypothetical protein